MGQAGCGFPASSRRGGDNNRPPVGPGPGNFPCLEPGQGDPQPGGGGGGGGGAAIRLEGDTRGELFVDRGERQSAGKAGAIRQIWRCPVDQ